MDVKIGVQHVPRELAMDTSMTAEQIEAALRSALDDRGVFTLTDSNGRTVLIPVNQLAYVEVTGSDNRRAGFNL